MIRIGNSFDIHKRDEKRKLILGGIEVQNYDGLVGHSDADVLTHVICESIIGALGLGDLGTLFPDTSNKYKDVSSITLLKYVLSEMNSNKYKIINIDTQIILNTPYMSKYKNRIHKNLVSVLSINKNQLNIKATRSEESITSINNDKAIFAFATCLLEKEE